MNISDKKFIELTERVWDRNKELCEEVKELKEEMQGLVIELAKRREELDCANDSLEKVVEKLRKDISERDKEIARLKQVCEENYEHIKELEEEKQDFALANDTLIEELKEHSRYYKDEGQLSNKEVNEMLVDLGGVLSGYPYSDLKITFNI